MQSLELSHSRYAARRDRKGPLKSCHAVLHVHSMEITVDSGYLSHGVINFPDCQKELGIFQG